MRDWLSKSELWGIFYILVLLNILDAATTAILVTKFGPDVEANPIMRYPITLYGVNGLYMMKFIVVSALGLVIAHLLRYYKKTHRAVTTARRSMWVLNAMLALIVVNNAILVFNTINT